MHYLDIFYLDEFDQKTRERFEKLVKKAMVCGQKHEDWDSIYWPEGFVEGYVKGYLEGLAKGWAISQVEGSPDWDIETALDAFRKDKSKSETFSLVAEELIEKALIELKAKRPKKKRVSTTGKIQIEETIGLPKIWREDRGPIQGSVGLLGANEKIVINGQTEFGVVVKLKEHSWDFFMAADKDFGHFMDLFDLKEYGQRFREWIRNLVREALSQRPEKKRWKCRKELGPLDKGWPEFFVVGYVQGKIMGMARVCALIWDRIWELSHPDGSPDWDMETALAAFREKQPRSEKGGLLSEETFEKALFELKGKRPKKKRGLPKAKSEK
ncbi:MAG: hypothetical protein LBF38_05285 [Deltaproteobacteria bacterium]|nr:hypothetical protein [Deltaproteobacteria bacterium]